MVALVATVVVIAALTLSPRSGSNSVELHPFGDFRTTDAVANLLLFVPLGASLCLRQWRFGTATAIGAAFSASIELAQLLIPGRTTSVDDVILNAIGTALGWAIVALIRIFAGGHEAAAHNRAIGRHAGSRPS